MHLQNKKEWKLQKICKKEIVENLKLTSTHTNYNRTYNRFLVQFNSRGEKTPDFIIWREFPAPSKTSLTARKQRIQNGKGVPPHDKPVTLLGRSVQARRTAYRKLVAVVENRISRAVRFFLRKTGVKQFFKARAWGGVTWQSPWFGRNVEVRRTTFPKQFAAVENK